MYNLLTSTPCLCGEDYLHSVPGAVTGLQGESAEGAACSQIAPPAAESRGTGSTGIVCLGEAAACVLGQPSGASHTENKPLFSGNEIFYVFVSIAGFGFRGCWWMWSLFSPGIS